MDTIKQILSDFYHCTHLGIQFLNEDLTCLESMGNVPPQLPTIVTQHLGLNATTEMTIDDTIHYIVAPFNETSQETGYFLIGAYQSKNEEDPEIPFKPVHLTSYFKTLFISIVKQNIANQVPSNPHITKGLDYIHQNYHQPLNLHLLSDYLNLNTCYFCVLFKNQTNLTFSQYLNKVRINESKKLLETTNHSIIDISLAVGFNNHNHFSATFKKLTGVTPTAYKNQLKK